MATEQSFSALTTDRIKVGNGEYLATVRGVRCRFVNVPAQNPNSTRAFAPFHANWKATVVETGKVIADAWSSRVGAAQAADYAISMARA